MTPAIVIGGGISGLVAAHRLAQSGDVLLFEASERAGGVIQTREGNGFLVELGPNSVRMTASAAPPPLLAWAGLARAIAWASFSTVNMPFPTARPSMVSAIRPRALSPATISK